MVYENTTRTCDNCTHKDVCAHSKDFIAYQQIIDSVRVVYKEQEIPLKDIPWAVPPFLECLNWAYKRYERDSYMNEHNRILKEDNT